MGHTYSHLMCHGVFSTKNRRTMLQLVPAMDLRKVIAEVVLERKGKLLEFGGTDNHVHLLATFHPSFAPADMFRDIKAISSDWVHTHFADLTDCAWQTGYGVFAVSKSASEAVAKYIVNQQEHHRKTTFEEELIRLLERHEIPYDPKYVFD